eukprot:gene9433-19595_t
MLSIIFLCSHFFGFAAAKTIRHIPSRGVVVCSSGKQVLETMEFLDGMRTKWNSSLSVAVAHCDEISGHSLQLLKEQYAAQVINVCSALMPYFTSLETQRQRLRSFYCKAAALINSPYDHTMLVDTDVIWFNKPDFLFDAVEFKNTGALFFRDRMIIHRSSESPKVVYMNHSTTVTMIGSLMKQNITQSIAINLSKSNGISFFWFHSANTSIPALRHIQDSSVLLLDRSSHKGMLDVLGELLPSFSLGYGDKEMYWIAATAAQENFSWEPYVFGMYGDCGALIHFDPREKNPDLTKPFFMNGEYLLECITKTGQDIETNMTRPLLVTSSTQIMSLEGRVHPVTRARCGACSALGCITASDVIRDAVLYAQTQRLQQKDRQSVFTPGRLYEVVLGLLSRQ